MMAQGTGYDIFPIGKINLTSALGILTCALYYVLKKELIITKNYL